MNYDFQIRQSSQAAALLRDHIAGIDHEELWALFLNGNNELISGEMLTKGTLSYTPIDARTILKKALLANATAVIIAHNHPSGNPRPSASDLHETERVRAACKLLDIELIDHIILSAKLYFSFADEVASKYKPLNLNKSWNISTASNSGAA